jgi:Domain of unknown function (DUF4304)
LTTSRESIEAELRGVVVPWLRAAGYKGSFPHLRRLYVETIDLLTFQFDRRGGGFIVEIARCPSSGLTTPWGKQIAPARVTAWDVHPNERTRIKPKLGSGTDSWFRYEDGRFKECATQLLETLQANEQVSGKSAEVVPSA